MVSPTLPGCPHHVLEKNEYVDAGVSEIECSETGYSPMTAQH